MFVAAAGNGGADGVGDNNDTTPHYPSSYNSANIISVAATNSQDSFASFSNYGAKAVDVTAPGVGILSTLPKNTYGSYSGTSMAPPHVAGAAALLKSKNPSLDDAEVKANLTQSVDKKSVFSGKTAAGGRLNAARALGIQVPQPPDPGLPYTAPPDPAPPDPAPPYAPPPSYGGGDGGGSKGKKGKGKKKRGR